jgi:threonine synthase
MYRCAVCDTTYPPDGPWRCACGGPLEYADDPRPTHSTPPTTIDHADGLWTFDDFLPVDRRVSLGEGWTPLVDVPALDASVKLEYCTPTASFKDRGAAVTLSQAAALGVERVLEDSSGNAGLAIATYAARAGIDARIFVPADAKPAKVRAVERTGADVRRIEGDRAAVTDACVAAVEAGEGWYASHAWNPAFFAGTATFALELAAQRDWSVPDAVVTPVGHGTLLLGAYRGFRALREVGWTDGMPRLLGVQAAGTAPLATARHGPSDGGEAAGDGPNDVADGIQISEPARRDQLEAALDATDGDAIAVSGAATERARDRLARLGFHVEPTSATALAGLDAYRDRGVLAADADVVVPLTGSGLKGT